MKETTLSDILVSGGEKDVLKLKRKLIRFKKSGYLFIKENISDLVVDQPFEIYYAPA